MSFGRPLSGASLEDVREAWLELHRLGLASTKRGRIIVSVLAMRRASTDTQRRLAAHLAGFQLTENSYIVRKAGESPGLPCILNTRIAVEHIANYFKEGWGVTEIERELQILKQAEIEAAIQYYLNHPNRD